MPDIIPTASFVIPVAQMRLCQGYTGPHTQTATLQFASIQKRIAHFIIIQAQLLSTKLK